MSLIHKLEWQGVKLTPKLRYQIIGRVLDAKTLALLKANKDTLLRDLVAPKAIPPLPWQIERLVSAASCGQLHIELSGIPDVSNYVMGSACAYLTGDQDEAVRRLWQVYKAWQGVR